jgi:pyruvate/2-oxoglutarate/acetoin dehydrogenase E1 component
MIRKAMWQASREAVERARAGEGPTLLEAMTFRFMGHYFGDPGAYIPKDEYAAALARDPMPATKAAVLQTKAASEADLEAIARDINAQIDDAVKVCRGLESTGARRDQQRHLRPGSARMSTVTAAAPETMSFTDAYRMALDEALESDPSVLLLGEDIGDKEGGGVFKVTKGLSTKYGAHRVRTTPISEQAILGAAVGAALAGMRPVAEIMLMNFITVAMDQIVNHAAKLRFMSGGQTGVPITIRTRTGAGAGTAGQHSDMLEAWFAHVAGIKVVVPSTPADAKGLLSSCIFDDDPCLFIEDGLTRALTGPAPPPGHRVPLGKAHVARSGSDVSVIGYGRPLRDTLVIAERLGARRYPGRGRRLADGFATRHRRHPEVGGQDAPCRGGSRSPAQLRRGRGSGRADPRAPLRPARRARAAGRLSRRHGAVRQGARNGVPL